MYNPVVSFFYLRTLLFILLHHRLCIASGFIRLFIKSKSLVTVCLSFLQVMDRMIHEGDWGTIRMKFRKCSFFFFFIN
jgi:hypothetical protein